MTSTLSTPASTTPSPTPLRSGPLGRIGLWVTDHRRIVTMTWLLVIVGLGVFAPGVERNLSGAGWQADGSESVAVRQLAQDHFGGNGSYAIQVIVHSTAGPLTKGDGPAVTRQVIRLLEGEPRLTEVVPPVPGVSLSPDGHTAVVLAGAGVDTNVMVRLAGDIKEDIKDLSTSTVEVNPTGASLLWSDFNEANLEAMLTSEMSSWPVTMAILVLAFGALVSAGLPLVLTMAGLVASAGSLVLINELVPVSIWAMNFAMMFSLALGIDYALFLVVRYRSARLNRTAREAIAETMDTAGKAVLLSGVTMLVSLSAVMLVPSPSFRSAAGGIMLSVLFVLAATLTLLPLTLFGLDDKLNRFALPWVKSGDAGSPFFTRWGQRLWRHPVASGLGSFIVLVALASPILGLQTAMPSIRVLPEDASARVGYDQVQDAFGEGAPGMLQIIVGSNDANESVALLTKDHGVAGTLPPMPAADGSNHQLLQAIPKADPSDPELVTTVGRLRADLPATALVGGPAVESIDLKSQLDRSTPLVIGVILALGFLLLLFALQAPLISLLGTLVSLLSTLARLDSRDSCSRTDTAQDSWDSSRRASSTRGLRCSSSP